MISVVIPLYNKAHTIRRTLSSVLAQSFQDFEVVIVNDGSLDNGVQVIREFTSDPRIRIIEQQNQGVSVARNNGVDAANYDWVSFLDGDDEWLPDYLKTVVKAIETFPSAGMICTGRFEKALGPDGKEASSHVVVARKYSQKTQIVEYFENPHVFSHTSTVSVTKDTFYRAEKFPVGMKNQQDLAFFYSAGLVSQVVYCGLPLGIYWGGVAMQATSGFSIQTRIDSFCSRVNRNHDLWCRLEKRNKVYPIFEKYEIRARMMGLLRGKDWSSIDSIRKNLDPRLIRMFPAFEFFLYRTHSLSWLGKAYIYFTKLVWRMHGFPIVGQRG